MKPIIRIRNAHHTTKPPFSNVMAATSDSPPKIQPESKSAKKKKAKAEAPAKPSSTLSDGDVTSLAPAETAVNGGDGAYESPYIKELNK